MVAYYLSCIHFVLREDEELAAVLKFVDSIGESSSALHSNHRTVAATFYLALVWLVAFKTVSHDRFSGRCCQYIGTKTDNTARRHIKLNVYTVTLCFHRN